jgi:uncharacterized membrane protein YfcA
LAYAPFERLNPRLLEVTGDDPLGRPALFNLGVCVSLLVGMTGIGGGPLMTPLLILLFGIHPATAVGTDLLYAAATKSAGTLVHGLNRNIDWRIVGRLAPGSVPMTALILLVSSRFGARRRLNPST